MNESGFQMRPTMNFRYLKTVILYKTLEATSPTELVTYTLQQQFINTMTDQTEWRDVPVVEG